MFFRIKRSTQLRKLMTAYCDRQSVEFNSIAFLFDGRRLRGEQTPDEVKLFYFYDLVCVFSNLSSSSCPPKLFLGKITVRSLNFEKIH